MSRARSRRLRPVRKGILRHDELVAAEPRDEDRFVDRPLQSFGDLLEQPIADRVTESVVDRLEVVEVDQVHAEAATVALHRVERVADPLAQRHAVRQAGELVVPRKPGDARLGLGALRHVLENDDRAAVGHEPPRQGEGALVRRRGEHLARARAAQKLLVDLEPRLVRGAARVVLNADAPPQELARTGAGHDSTVRQARQFEEALVPDKELLLPVEHAQAVRHVVER